uniref:Uncharacterized protein n=1 Tax=Kuenenia stuttgartiensis TaxID=174633 RepID=Q1Q015_KUEST|nr:unknown protein [Candidatus Kuenenia stuttgartiensis]
MRIPTTAGTAKDRNNFHKNTSVICEDKPHIYKDRLKSLNNVVLIALLKSAQSMVHEISSKT